LHVLEHGQLEPRERYSIHDRFMRLAIEDGGRIDADLGRDEASQPAIDGLRTEEKASNR
jgi:hypothetical protein